jgi:hypothetical protein
MAKSVTSGCSLSASLFRSHKPGWPAALAVIENRDGL